MFSHKRFGSYLRSPQDGSDFGSAQWETHVTRVSGGNGIHGQTTSLIGSSGQSSGLVGVDGSAHLENIALVL
jgi:hypothetical protein